MFWIAWIGFTLFFEFIVKIEEWIAKGDKTYSRKDMLAQYPNHFVVAFEEHGGMIGDRWIVSPLAGWILAYFITTWDRRSIGVMLLVSGAVMGLIFWFWTKGTEETVDSFGEFGFPRTNGWIHCLYAIMTLTPILLFFFRTPNVTFWQATIVSVLLLIHLGLGMLQPEVAARTVIRPFVWKQFAGAVAVLVFAWYRVAFR